MTTDASAGGGRGAGRFEKLFPFAADVRRLDVAAGTHLHEPAMPATAVYYVHSGQVRIYQIGPDDGSVRLVEILGTDDWFGATALARGRSYGTRAVAVTDAAISEVPADRWLAALAQTPDVAADVIRDLARKLQAAQDDAARLVFDDCNQRLIKTLLHFSGTAAATPRDEDGGVVLRITHQQLAQAVGAARETVSLALTTLRQRQLLRTGRNQLFFNPDVLRQSCKRAAGVTGSAAGAPPSPSPSREYRAVAADTAA